MDAFALGCKIAGYGFALGSHLSQAAGACMGVAFTEKSGEKFAKVSEACDVVCATLASVGGGAIAGAFLGTVGGWAIGMLVSGDAADMVAGAF